MMMIGIGEDAAAVRDEGRRRWEVERKVTMIICKPFFQKQLGWINSDLSEQSEESSGPFCESKRG